MKIPYSIIKENSPFLYLYYRPDDMPTAVHIIVTRITRNLVWSKEITAQVDLTNYVRYNMVSKIGAVYEFVVDDGTFKFGSGMYRLDFYADNVYVSSGIFNCQVNVPVMEISASV